MRTRAGCARLYPEHIDGQLQKAFAELGDTDRLHELDLDAFAAKMAHFLAGLNAIHPFREGNGRTQLAFLSMLAAHVGYTFDADVLERDRIIAAMVESFDGSEAPLAGLIRDLIG